MAVTIQIDQHQTEGSIEQWLDDIVTSMEDLRLLSPTTPTGRTPEEKRRRRRERNSSRQRALAEAISPTSLVGPVSGGFLGQVNILSSSHRRRTLLERELELAASNNIDLINELTQPSIAIPRDRNSRRSNHFHSGQWVTTLMNA